MAEQNKESKQHEERSEPVERPPASEDPEDPRTRSGPTYRQPTKR